MKLSVIYHAIGTDEKDRFKEIKACGFDAVEYPLDGLFGMTDEELKAHCAEIKAQAAEAGIEIGQTHSDFSGYAADYRSDFDEIIARQIVSIKATHYLGCRYCIISPLIFPGRIYGKPAEENYEKTVWFYRQLIPTLEQYDVYACIENVWAYDPYFQHICPTVLSHAEELTAACDACGDRFKICINTGHCQVTADDVLEMVRVCKDRLAVLHCNENDGISDLHTLPYSLYRAPTGRRPKKTDWEALMKTLKDVGYTGNLNFEVEIRGPKELGPGGLRLLAAIGRYLVSVYEGENK